MRSKVSPFVSLVACLAALATCTGKSPPPGAGSTKSKSVLPATAAVLASKFLGGNAKFDLPTGSPGIVVIAKGPVQNQAGGATLGVVVRNNTSGGVADVEIAATARNLDGKVISSGSSQGSFVPVVIEPGNVAIGYVYFRLVQLPKDAKLQMDVSSQSPSDQAFGSLDVKVSEVNHAGARIAGTVANTLGKKISGPLSILVTCFDARGKVLSSHSSYAEKNDLPVSATSPFQVDLFEDQCPFFIVGSRGHAS